MNFFHFQIIIPSPEQSIEIMESMMGYFMLQLQDNLFVSSVDITLNGFENWNVLVGTGILTKEEVEDAILASLAGIVLMENCLVIPV